ncbi:MAG: RHS repeat-associated core domain-containing protein, partial [Bacteroidota bacterium]
ETIVNTTYPGGQTNSTVTSLNDAESTRLKADITNWFNQNGYSYNYIDVDLNDNDLLITFSDVKIDRIVANKKFDYYVKCLEGNSAFGPFQYERIGFVNQKTTLSNYEFVACSNPVDAALRSSSGTQGLSQADFSDATKWENDADKLTYPTAIYQVSTTKSSGQKVTNEVLLSEFKYLDDNLKQEQKLTVNSKKTKLVASLANGERRIVNVQGLLDTRINEDVVGLDLADQREVTSIRTDLSLLTDCPNIEPPICSAETEAAQRRSVEAIYEDLAQNGVKSDGLSFPTTLHAILLCDGSIAYILEDQLENVEGGYTPINTIDIASADDLIAVSIRATGPNQLFAMTLDYEDNGNVETATWKTTYHTPKRYVYEYDELNRIKSATYSEVVGATADPGNPIVQDMFSVSNITYDAIGNILTLDRRGVIGCGTNMQSDYIDQLTYSYFNQDVITSPNQEPPVMSQLSAVVDAASQAGFREQGFHDQSEGNPSYVYDGAGRMEWDPYKRIGIDYNHLDLPASITTKDNGDIEVLYDATGRKWIQRSQSTTRMYVGGMEFVKDGSNFELEAANTGDGRLVVGQNDEGETSATGDDPEGIYAEYHHKDHLGNVRVTFTDRNDDNFVELLGTGNQIEVSQQVDYYPFGLQQQGRGLFHEQQQPENRYRFNGIEHEELAGLDLALYRSLDPALGRWMQVDPAAVSIASISPYQSMGNNPIRYSDPNGDFIPQLAAGLAGGALNLVKQAWQGNVTSLGEGLSYFAVGAASGVAASTGNFALSRAIAVGGNKIVQLATGKWDPSNLGTLQGLVGTAFDVAGDLALPEQALGLGAELEGPLSKLFDSFKTTSSGGGMPVVDKTIGLTSDVEFGGTLDEPVTVSAVRPVGKYLQSANDIMANPSLVEGQSYATVRAMVDGSEGWIHSEMLKTRSIDKGWVFRQVNENGQLTGKLIQYHPGTHRHFGGHSYWKVSDGTNIFKYLTN